MTSLEVMEPAVMVRKERKWNLESTHRGFSLPQHAFNNNSIYQLTNNYSRSSIHFNNMWMHAFVRCITHNLGVFSYTLCYRIIYHWGEASALCLLKIFMIFYLGKQGELHFSPGCNWKQMIILCRNRYMFGLWGTSIVWLCTITELLYTWDRKYLAGHPAYHLN